MTEVNFNLNLYRYIELRNGVRILLASDPNAVTSGAALDIRVGSFHDPVPDSINTSTLVMIKNIVWKIFMLPHVG